MTFTGFLDGVRNMQFDGEGRGNNSADAIKALNAGLRDLHFQYQLKTGLARMQPEIARGMRSNFGVLVRVIINDCGDGGGRVWGGMELIGAGNTPFLAYQKRRTGLWASCGSSASLWLWFTPFGMSVVSPEHIKASEFHGDMQRKYQKIIDAINRKNGVSDPNEPCRAY